MAETFAIWKPKGISSFRALGAIKRLYPGERVGHGGTLDPLAEGILVVAVGREATRTIHEAVAAEKEYVATVRFGATSLTDDAEGPIQERDGVAEVSREKIEAALTKYVGSIMQRPPQFSAVHVQGKRAYDLARAGKQVVLEPREVLVKEAELVAYAWPEATIRYVTGPGVYIRSLVRDLGEALGVGAYMSDLIRTRVGHFTKETVREF
jgi:tRNA pseudouridine55 synthase